MSNSNETKGGLNSIPNTDDDLYWDDTGDNWNSRIADMDDFPKISVPHAPSGDAPGDSEDPNDEYDHLDELVPDYDHANANASAYWATFGALSGTVDEDIQALMITAAQHHQGNIPQFNVRMGGTVYEDTSGYYVQNGDSDAGTDERFTYANYLPWTPDGNHTQWAAGNFGTSDFGAEIFTDESDQITVQAIYFGDGFEWPFSEPPAGHAYSQVAVI
jgi:hypothetical protein